MFVIIQDELDIWVHLQIVVLYSEQLTFSVRTFELYATLRMMTYL